MYRKIRPGRLPSTSCEHFARAFHPNIQPSNNVTLIISLWFIRFTHHQIRSSRSPTASAATPTNSISHNLRESRCVWVWIFFLYSVLIYSWSNTICLSTNTEATQNVFHFYCLPVCLLFGAGRRCTTHFKPTTQFMMSLCPFVSSESIYRIMQKKMLSRCCSSFVAFNASKWTVQNKYA